MNLRRLPEIDLANIAPLEKSLKRPRLEVFNKSGGYWSYDPLRNQLPNILNPDVSLPLEIAKPSDEQILAAIEKRCKHPVQKSSCVELAELTMGWAKANVSRATDYRFRSLYLGSLGYVRYWTNMVFNSQGKNTIAFFDHRRQHGLTRIGRKVAFSIMHEQIRVPNPDLADAELMIVKFAQDRKEKKRSYQIYRASELENLFEFEAIFEMIQETYEIWADIQKSKTAKPKRKDTGTGDLFDEAV